MDMKICERIGICKVDSDGNIVELQREFFSQGWVFKDWEAFQNRPDAPCYVTELDDAVYEYSGVKYITRPAIGNQSSVFVEIT